MIDAGVAAETALFIPQEFDFAYWHGETPCLEDRIFSVLEVDPDDLEDAIQKYWTKRGWILPSRAEPKLVPGDPSLLEIAVWLEHQGDVQAHP